MILNPKIKTNKQRRPLTPIKKNHKQTNNPPPPKGDGDNKKLAKMSKPYPKMAIQVVGISIYHISRHFYNIILYVQRSLRNKSV